MARRRKRSSVVNTAGTMPGPLPKPAQKGSMPMRRGKGSVNIANMHMSGTPARRSRRGR